MYSQAQAKCEVQKGKMVTIMGAAGTHIASDCSQECVGLSRVVMVRRHEM